MRLRQWGRRSIQTRLIVALGLLTAVSLAAGAIAWVGLSRTERALLRDQAAGLSDLRHVLGLAERSARLAAEAPALARASGDGMVAREADELKAGIAELRVLATALPSSIRANASVPTEVPSIVRLSERLDGILDHLIPVIAEQIALGRDLGRQREGLGELVQQPEATGAAASARLVQRALALRGVSSRPIRRPPSRRCAAGSPRSSVFCRPCRRTRPLSPPWPRSHRSSRSASSRSAPITASRSFWRRSSVRPRN